MIYTIIQDRSINKLQDRVNSFLKQGWQPLGGAFLNPSFFGYNLFCQTMVTDKPFPKTPKRRTK